MGSGERDPQHNFHRLPCLHTQEGARSRSRPGVHSFSKQRLRASCVPGSPGAAVTKLQSPSLGSLMPAGRKLVIIHTFISSVSRSIITPFTRVSQSRFHVGLLGCRAGCKTRSQKGRGPLKCLPLPGVSSHLWSLGLSLATWTSEGHLS